MRQTLCADIAKLTEELVEAKLLTAQERYTPLRISRGQATHRYTPLGVKSGLSYSPLLLLRSLVGAKLLTATAP